MTHGQPSRHAGDLRRLIAAGERVRSWTIAARGSHARRAAADHLGAGAVRFACPDRATAGGIIRFYGNPVQDMLSRLLEQSLGTVMQQRSVQRRWRRRWKAARAARRADAPEHWRLEPDAGLHALGANPQSGKPARAQRLAEEPGVTRIHRRAAGTGR